MVALVGKYILSIVCILFFGILRAEQQAITVRTLDLQGMPAAYFTCGIPFKLELMLAESMGTTDTPHITLPPEAHIVKEQVHTRLYITQGKQTTQKYYTYIVRIDTPGTFLLGPAKITTPQGIFVSSTSTVTLNENSTHDLQQQALSSIVHKQRVFQGEDIPITVRLSVDERISDIGQLELPSTSTCMFTLAGKPTITREGKYGTRTVVTWHVQARACTSGNICIPAFKVVYYVPDQRFSFFGLSHETRTAYSNTAQIQVEALPIYSDPTKTIQIIGQDISCTAQLQQNVAEQATTLTITLEGTANFADLSHIFLQLPEGLKYYTSRSTLESTATGKQRKNFEYIIQGIHNGIFTIPAQDIIYFDTEKRAYITLSTVPLSLTITNAGNILEQEKHIYRESNQHQDKQAPEYILLSVQQLEAYTHKPRVRALLSFNLIIFLMIMPFLYYGYYYARTSIRKYIPRKNALFKHAHTKIMQAQQQKDSTQIPRIFINLFSTLLQKHITTLEEIDHVICDNEQLCKEWHLFVMCVLAHIYATKPYDSTVFEKAHRWVDVFQEVFSN